MSKRTPVDPMKPTAKQIECLRQTKADGGILELGGPDGRKINGHIWGTCIQRGWLTVEHWVEPYAPWIALKLTDAGRALVS